MNKADFPFFETNEVVYLDNAATTQMSKNTIRKILESYENNANPGKGVYLASLLAEKKRETARQKVADFLGVNPEQIAFTSGTTAALNMLAFGLKRLVSNGDKIVVSVFEHRSNFLPWQRLAKDVGAEFEILANFSDEELASKITAGTKIVAVTAKSNVTGLRPPLAKIAKRAHLVGAKLVVDLAQFFETGQAIALNETEIDFAACSAHKIYGPMGIGALYARDLNALEPMMLGGGTEPVGFSKLEAGTPNLPAIVGFSAAVEEFSNYQNCPKKLETLTRTLEASLLEIPGVKIYGAEGGIVSFNFENAHPHDLAELLAERKIAVRAGALCAEPLMKKLGVSGVVRASLGVYNTVDDVEKFLAAILEVQKILEQMA
ncbi:aminotransferase class V-fold PLP-dependent enzyme [Candidatus Saccharibacteria bacterium]|nr:aminotransferase class V-fold PLP-dependent enzyme [Candidatus Saccharibacteria bacterium]